MEYPKDLSIVISLYNEEESLPELVRWIEKVMNQERYSYEVIMVDDGSTDGSWKLIKRLSDNNSNIRGISFRRNYGKSAALFHGFKAAEGKVVVTMDADLQDSPAFSEDIHYEIVKLSADTIAIFDAIECIKKYKYCRRYYTVWVRFTPDQELQQRMDNATEYSQQEFQEFDQQR